MKRIILYILLLLPSFTFAADYLTGTKTISSTGSGINNYTTIASAIADLYDKGVFGNLVFQLTDAQYVGQQFILSGDIPNSSPTNTVTFRSQTKDPNDVEITHTASGSADNYIVNINEAQYVNFDALTFTAGASSYGRIVYSENPLGNVTFDGNIFNGLTGAGTDVNKAIVYCVADNAAENLDFYDFNNNQFNEGSYGLFLRSHSTNLSNGLNISSNTFSTNTTNIYLDYFSAFTIEENISTKSGSTFAYQIHNSNSNFFIRYNRILSLNNIGKGIRLFSCNTLVSGIANIHDNFIQASDEGINIFSSKLIDVINNSINIEHPSLGADNSTNALIINSTSTDINVQANLLINKRSGYTFNAHAGNISSSNNNNLYTTGINIAKWNSTNYTSLFFLHLLLQVALMVTR